MYDTVKIIFEKDGEQVVCGEVLPRDNPEDTLRYLIENFWTLHKVVEATQEVEPTLVEAN